MTHWVSINTYHFICWVIRLFRISVFTKVYINSVSIDIICCDVHFPVIKNCVCYSYGWISPCFVSSVNKFFCRSDIVVNIKSFKNYIIWKNFWFIIVFIIAFVERITIMMRSKIIFSVDDCWVFNMT